MSIKPMYKRCFFCGKKYSWNPSVGQLVCPYCLRKSIEKENRQNGSRNKKD